MVCQGGGVVIQRIKGSATAVVLVGIFSGAHATNGYSPTGFGAANKGIAGAGVALPQDALAGATNPAGMVHVGERLDVGLAVFNPHWGFTADDNGAANPPPPSVPAGSYDSENDLFLIPHFGWNTKLTADSSIGVLLGANGGMNTEYDTAVWRNFSNPAGTASAPTGVDFAQMFIGVPYAVRLNDSHSFGVMPIVAVQRFKAEGLEPFRAFSVAPTKLTNNGYDLSWGWGLRVGWLGQINVRLALGASAQTRLRMQRFDRYEGLFAEQGDFDVPPTVTAGFSFDVTPDLTLVGDWQRIFYGEVKSLSNPNDTVIGPDTLLGSDDGLGFGWRDIDIFKLGVVWRYSPQLTLRAGVSHADQLFNNGEALFNVLAPATVRTHASLGMTYRLEDGNALTLAYTRAFFERIDGVNPNFTGPQTGSAQMDQHELELSWAWIFD